MVMFLILVLFLYMVIDREEVERSIDEKLERWDKAK